MPTSCVAVACAERHRKGSSISFHRFPADKSRRKQWAVAVKRENWTPTPAHRICGKHFVTGEPSDDPHHPDYVPTIFAHEQNKKAAAAARLQRARARAFTREVHPMDTYSQSESSQVDSGADYLQDVSTEGLTAVHLSCHDTDLPAAASGTDADLLVAVPCYICKPEFQALEKRVTALERENKKQERDFSVLKKELLHSEQRAAEAEQNARRHFSAKCITEQCVSLYTGLQSKALFIFFVSLFENVSMYVPKHCTIADVLIILMKFKLALLNLDLSHRFGISETAVARIMVRNIPAIAAELKRFIIWPSRKDVCRTMPMIVRRKYPTCMSITDCTEVWIQRPLGFTSRSHTYSHYKGCNTIKFMVSITPCGAISFITKCWGGRASDKEIILKSYFLDKLQEGDIVLADRGFLIRADVALRGARLEVPALTRGKRQLSAKQMEDARHISRVRIHVEQAIGRLKLFRILRDQMPITMLRHASDIVVICAAITNLKPRLA